MAKRSGAGSTKRSEGSLSIQGNAEFGALHDDPAPVTDTERSIALCKHWWQAPVTGKGQPESQQVTAPCRVLVIDESAAVMEKRMVVDELDVPRLEVHGQVHIGLVGNLVEQIERFATEVRPNASS